jgi:hypothetical protein
MAAVRGAIQQRRSHSPALEHLATLTEALVTFTSVCVPRSEVISGR